MLNGKVQAGAIDHRLFATLPEETRKVLTILGETETIARQVALVRSDMDTAQQEAIKAVLLKMDTTTEGQAILKNFEETARFDDFPTTTSLQRMRQLFQLIQGE